MKRHTILFFSLTLLLASPALFAQSGSGESPSYVADMKHYPNPFDQTFILEYTLVKDMQISLLIFDQSGKRVKTWFEGRQPAGKQSLMWDGSDNAGVSLVSGMYSYIMISDGVVIAKDRVMKM